MRTKLRLNETDYRQIRTHLFPGDGCEAVIIALCGRAKNDNKQCLTVQTLVAIPYDECKIRRPDRITWATDRLIPLLQLAVKDDLAILKVHSHPSGYADFSRTDDASDKDLFASISLWTESRFPHASAIMLPDGRMFGRSIARDGAFEPLESILIPGDDILFWPADLGARLPSFVQRHAQLFGTGTTSLLRNMSVAVVGCSGTGSPVVEQLARLGIGRLVLIDPDRVEAKNLNRIVSATREDSYLKRYKVEALARAVAAMGLGTELEIISEDLATPQAVRAVAGCDAVFGCMDGVEGRHLLNRLSSFYLLPYFDLGIKLDADGSGGIDGASGAVHYLRPDGETLQDRGVYTPEDLIAAGLQRTDPKAYNEQLEVGYIRGVPEERPAVISINMQVASTAVNEFLARIHPYRLDANSEAATVRISFVQGHTYREPECNPSGMFKRHLGRGDTSPLLGMPELSEGETC